MITVQNFKIIATGEVQGGTTAAQLPDIPCAGVMIKAQSDNATNVYIGTENVTVNRGHTNETTGWELDAGDETRFLPIDNLNKLWMITDANADDIIYIAFR